MSDSSRTPTTLGMARPNLAQCQICWAPPSKATIRIAGTVTMAQKISLGQKIFQLLDYEVPESSAICPACNDIIEQIDFFEDNLNNSKLSLKSRMLDQVSTFSMILLIYQYFFLFSGWHQD